MARPWKMKWPYLCKDGRKSWQVGYRDHEGTVRGKAFASSHAARQWMSDFQDAERRGRDSLMRFVLDLDAQEQNAVHKGLVLGEVVQLYLAHNGPEEEDGLARATFENYRGIANLYLLGHPRHTPRREELPPHAFAQRMALTPIAQFNDPQPSRAFWDEMLRAGVTKEARVHARRVLSAILSWGAWTDLVPELHTNGCKLANEQRSTRRRSARHSGGGVARRRRHGDGAESWALSALAVEHIRVEMLRRTGHKRPLLIAQRDAMVVSLQYGLAARNQEVYGLRWENVEGDVMHFVEVVATGYLDEGKTAGSTPRTCLMPACLVEDLARWRSLLEEAGHPVRPRDFIIPGDLASSRQGLCETEGDGCHFTQSQTENWGPRYFRPAVSAVAQAVEGMANIAGAKPYSLRRGGMTARVRSEDAQMVVGECGTSLDMLNRHYSFALAEYRGKGPQPFDEIWREARERVFGSADPLLPPPLPPTDA
jgi:integrase